MIRNETEYQEASERLAQERQRLVEHKARLKTAGLAEEEIKRVIDRSSPSTFSSRKRWRATRN